jgi:hypothetical protein
VKTGFNLAFVVRREAYDECGTTAIVAANGRRGRVESAVMRPVIRGEYLRAWHVESSNEYVLWTHAANGLPHERLPAHVSRWLTPWRQQLSTRADGRGACWWSLFRIDSARVDRPRVVWADMGRSPRATVLLADDPSVPLNSCYVTLCRDEDDALTLAAILNSPLAEAWLAALAEPARGGYRRFLGWTMSLLPLPTKWSDARAALAPIARSALGNTAEPRDLRDALLDETLRAYGVGRDEMAALLAWFAG